MSQDALNGRKPWPALGLRDMRNREPEAFSELDELNVSTAGQVEMEATRLGVFWKAGRGTHRRCPWHFSRDREPERGGTCGQRNTRRELACCAWRRGYAEPRASLSQPRAWVLVMQSACLALCACEQLTSEEIIEEQFFSSWQMAECKSGCSAGFASRDFQGTCCC